jgi:hypothetical protein
MVFQRFREVFLQVENGRDIDQDLSGFPIFKILVLVTPFHAEKSFFVINLSKIELHMLSE